MVTASVAIGIYDLLPHLHTLPHSFPFLINLIVSVNVKHHVLLSCPAVGSAMHTHKLCAGGAWDSKVTDRGSNLYRLCFQLYSPQLMKRNVAHIAAHLNAESDSECRVRCSSTSRSTWSDFVRFARCVKS